MELIDSETVLIILDELKTFASRRFETFSRILLNNTPYAIAFLNSKCLEFSIPNYHNCQKQNTDELSHHEISYPVYNHYKYAIDSLLIDYLYPHFNDLFSSCSTEDGKNLSKLERKEMKNSCSTLIYGEIAFDSYCHILWSDIVSLVEKDATSLSNSVVSSFPLSETRRGGVYYDLGSGTGRALFASAYCHSFDKIVGVEILKSLHDAAEDCKKIFTSQISENITPNVSIDLICGSFFDPTVCDWSDGDLIFANSTCFSDEMFIQIAQMCVNLKPGTIVITFSVELEASYLKLLALKNYKMSWGNASVYIHKRI